MTPTNPIIQLDLNATGSQAFTATGTYADGTSADISSQATWTVGDATVGTMSGATLDIPAFSTVTADVSTITATLNGVVGDAQITVVAYKKSGLQPDSFFILPYQDPSGAQSQPLDFSTAIPGLDVFFLVDTTGSMGGEVQSLQSGIASTVLPGIQTTVSNSQFGVGALEDFPIYPYGNSDALSSCGAGLSRPDQPFQLIQAITSNVTAVAAGVNALSDSAGDPIGCGGDWPSSGIEGIYQAATGEGLFGPTPTNVPPGPPGVGGVGFRKGAMPVIVTVTDADSHAAGATGTCTTTGDQEAYSGSVASVAHTRAETKTALGKICARVVGIAAIQTAVTSDCQPLGYLQDLATATGARVPPAAWSVGSRPAGCAAGQCCTGFGGAGQAPDTDGLCPVVFKVRTDGTGVNQSIVSGIQTLASFGAFDVPTDKQGQTTDANGNPLPAGHTTADFIKAVTPTSFTVPASPPGLPTPTFDTTTFHNVAPGTTLSFNVNAFNDVVPQTSQPQLFRVTIRALAGGCTPLDTHSVLILVPPLPK